MLIKWFGECSFLLQDSLGRRILTDPPNTVSIDRLLNLHPNIITLSHYYPDTVNAILSDKNILLINEATSYNLNFSNITGISSFQDNMEGKKRGPNIIYKYSFDNLKICNLGYLGHNLSNDVVLSLGKIDILFLPIGGHFTIDSTAATKLANIIKPKIIIPMYYRTPNSLIYLDSCKNFILSMKSIKKLNEDFLDTNLFNHPSYPVTIILKENKIGIQKKIV